MTYIHIQYEHLLITLNAAALFLLCTKTRMLPCRETQAVGSAVGSMQRARPARLC